MYFEIYDNGKLIKRGDHTLEPLSWDNELMYVPACELVLPIDWLQYVNGREEVKIYINDKVFWGIVWDIVIDKVEEKITLDVRHVISEWQYRQISVNHAISNEELNVVYKGSEQTEANGETITASDFNVSLEQAPKLSAADIIERASASAWKSSNGDKVAITSVKIQKCSSETSASPDVLQSWYDAMVTQFAWSINQDSTFVTPTIQSSRDHGTCITFVAVSLQRIGYLPSGGYFYANASNGRITGDSADYVREHTELFKMSYPKKNLRTMVSQGKLIKGDIVSFKDPAYHTMVYMGTNSNGDPIFNTMGSVKGLGITYPSHSNRKVDLLVRLVGGEPTKVNDCKDMTSMSEEGSYRITFSTAMGTSVTIEVSVDAEYEPDYSSIGDPAVVDKLEDIYNDMNFAYPGWNINIQDGKTEMIDYVYSRQNKLDALTQTMELTDDLFWRVGFTNSKTVQIGKFGKKRPYIFSMKPAGQTNIQIIEEPEIDYDFENVINVATVYSDKSDSGMSSLTLRDVYKNPQYQKDGFPVVILHSNVNNERDYSAYTDQPPTIASNNELEYAVLDEVSIALESGKIIEGTYSYNDMSPFELDGRKVTDKERISSARTVYDRTIRKLIQARRSYDVTIRTTAVPADLWVGDRVRLLYDNDIWQMDKCASYWKKILSYDDWFYISRISYDFDSNETEVCEVTLTKWLKIERETWNE